MDTTLEKSLKEVIGKNLFSFSFDNDDDKNKSYLEDTKFKEIENLSNLLMKELIQDIIIIDEKNIDRCATNHPESVEFHKKITAGSINFNELMSNHEEQMKHIEEAITLDKVTKQIIIQFSALLSSFSSEKLPKFIDFLKIKKNFINLCKGPGFINLIEPLFHQCESLSNKIDLANTTTLKSPLLDNFLRLLNDNFDSIIYDKKTFKIIEKILKQNIISHEFNKIKNKLLENLYKYSINQFSCHVIKVFISVCQLNDSIFE